MNGLSQNYHLRNSYFKNNDVPTQSVMKHTMKGLANVYFKSMTPKLKVLAGLEPPLKGGGSDWYVPPEEILKGRSVLKPLNKEIKDNLNFIGIDAIGMKLVEKHRQRMVNERTRLLYEYDLKRRQHVLKICDEEYKTRAIEEAEHNKNQIRCAFDQFTAMYRTTVTKFQDLLFDAAVEKIKKIREITFQKMDIRYQRLLKQQAVFLYDEYTEKLMNEKARLKTKFIEDIEVMRTKMSDKMHGINLEKHVAIEKSRKFLECQNLASLIYVALKERQECVKETDILKQDHAKKMNVLSNQLDSLDFKILVAEEKEKKRREFNKMWMKKVCLVVKRFQQFVTYSLKQFPEHADFFINVEKLMLLQFSEVINYLDVNSLFVYEIIEQYERRMPEPKPFYLVCDKNDVQAVSQGLCPKHFSSNASQLPALVINNRYIYAACDNFEQFSDMIRDYIDHGIEDDIVDKHEYNYDVPVEYSISQQVLELKLESSLQQVLQKEIANLKGVPSKCAYCDIPYCFCSVDVCSRSRSPSPTKANDRSSQVSVSSGNKIQTREAELYFERQPKWEKYMQYVVPKKCDCRKKAKHHLSEHLPAYMKRTSRYEPIELPNYEPCPLETLKMLVKKSRRRSPPPAPVLLKESKTREVATQIDDKSDLKCVCDSDEAINFCRALMTEGNDYMTCNDDQNFRIVGSSVSSISLAGKDQHFAIQRALSLQRLMDYSPEIKEIFITKDCSAQYN